jgi:hypothetical protein
VLLSEEDAVAEKGEACSSVHLARDPLGFGVDALGRAVAVGKRERGDHVSAVSVQTSSEGVHLRQIGCADLDDPAREPVGVFCARRQESGEVPDADGQLGQRRRGPEQASERAGRQRPARSCRASLPVMATCVRCGTSLGAARFE